MAQKLASYPDYRKWESHLDASIRSPYLYGGKETLTLKLPGPPRTGKIHRIDETEKEIGVKIEVPFEPSVRELCAVPSWLGPQSGLETDPATLSPPEQKILEAMGKLINETMARPSDDFIDARGIFYKTDSGKHVLLFGVHIDAGFPDDQKRHVVATANEIGKICNEAGK